MDMIRDYRKAVCDYDRAILALQDAAEFLFWAGGDEPFGEGTVRTTVKEIIEFLQNQ